MDIQKVSINQGVTLDFMHLSDTAEGEQPSIFVPNFKPQKFIGSVALITFEAEQRRK